MNKICHKAFFVILCVVCMRVHIRRAEHRVFLSCSYVWRLGLLLNLELNELANGATQQALGICPSLHA